MSGSGRASRPIQASRAPNSAFRRLELTLDAASLNTGNGKRDEHLRSADFIDAQQHPEVRFQSTSVNDSGDGRLDVDGELLAAGNRVALELRPTLQETDDQLWIGASTTLDQRKLGMTWSHSEWRGRRRRSSFTRVRPER